MLQKASRTETISFRLPHDLAAMLRDQAKQRNMSRGDLARQFVINALSDDEASDLRRKVDAVLATHDSIRRDLATAVTALLVYAGKVERADAERWVRDNLV